MQTGEGIEVREAINQGFVRVELATLSDDDVSRVYSSAAESKNFTVLKRFVACFLIIDEQFR